MQRTTDILSYKVVGGLSNEPLTISRYAFKLLLKEENTAELLTLYLFYLHIRKKENTEYFKCPVSFIMSSLKWGRDKVRKYKKILIELGFIYDGCVKNENGKVIQWLVGIRYIDKNHGGVCFQGGGKRKEKTKKRKQKKKGDKKEKKRKEINKEKKSPFFARENNNKIELIMDKINSELSKEFIKNKTFQNNLKDWLLIRKEKRSPVTETVIKRFINRTKTFPIEIMTQALENSANNGWTGCFPEKVNNKITKPNNTTTNGYQSGTRKFKDYDEITQ